MPLLKLLYYQVCVPQRHCGDTVRHFYWKRLWYAVEIFIFILSKRLFPVLRSGLYVPSKHLCTTSWLSCKSCRQSIFALSNINYVFIFKFCVVITSVKNAANPGSTSSQGFSSNRWTCLKWQNIITVYKDFSKIKLSVMITMGGLYCIGRAVESSSPFSYHFEELLA